MPATETTEQTPKGGPIDVEALIDKHVGELEERKGAMAEARAEARAEAKPETETPVAAAEATPTPPPVTTTNLPKPHWRDTLIEGDDVPAYFRDKKGLKVGDLAASFEQGQAATTRAQQEAAEARRAAEDMRVRLIAMETMQRSAPQQQQATTPPEPQVDPRLVEAARIQLEDPDRAEALRSEYWEERTQKIAEQQTKSAIATFENEATIRQNRAVGLQALESAASVLELRGVPRKTFEKRAKALLVEVTEPNGPYWANGGPLRSDNLIGAYVDVFGLPEAPAPAVAAAPAPEPTPIIVPAAPPPATATPGGSKPSPASGPPPAKTALKREVSQALESLADEFSHLKLNRDRMLSGAGEGA